VLFSSQPKVYELDKTKPGQALQLALLFVEADCARVIFRARETGSGNENR